MAMTLMTAPRVNNKNMLKTETLREEFMAKGLQQSELDGDPYLQFESWYQQTMDSDLAEPTAMALSTVDANGQPW